MPPACRTRTQALSRRSAIPLLAWSSRSPMDTATSVTSAARPGRLWRWTSPARWRPGWPPTWAHAPGKMRSTGRSVTTWFGASSCTGGRRWESISRCGPIRRRSSPRWASPGTVPRSLTALHCSWPWWPDAGWSARRSATAICWRSARMGAPSARWPATAGSMASVRRACASRTPWHPSGPARIISARCPCWPCWWLQTVMAMPSRLTAGNRASAGTWPGLPLSMTVAGSSGRCPAGRSAVHRPMAAATIRRSRCCSSPAQPCQPTGWYVGGHDGSRPAGKPSLARRTRPAWSRLCQRRPRLLPRLKPPDRSAPCRPGRPARGRRGAGQAGSGGRRRGIIAAVIVAIIVAAVLATMAVVLLRQPWAGTSSPSGTVNNAPTGHRTASRTQLPSPAASVPGQGGKNAKSPATSGAQTPTSDVTGAGQQKGG